jgi:hypothetical protein
MYCPLRLSRTEHSGHCLRSAVSVTALLAWMICLPLHAAQLNSWPHRQKVGDVVQGEVYTARLASVLQIPRPGRGKVWQYTFEVENRKTHAVKILQFGGAGQTVEDELEWFGLGGERLFVTTAFEIGAFSLATQKLEENLVVDTPVPSPDGSRIAYRVLQPRGFPQEDGGSIVVVLDLATMTHRYVFPEPSRVVEFRNGPEIYPIVTEADPAKQHQVLNLFWSQDGSRLVFFCGHGFLLRPEVGPMYIVVVDVHQLLTGTRFVHQPIDPSTYGKKGAPAGKDTIHFVAETITWLNADTISVRPRSDFSWVKDPFVLKLPAVPLAAGVKR